MTKQPTNQPTTQPNKKQKKIPQTNQNLQTKQKDPPKGKQQQKQVEIHEPMSLYLGQQANRTVIPEKRGRNGVLR